MLMCTSCKFFPLFAALTALVVLIKWLINAIETHPTMQSSIDLEVVRFLLWGNVAMSNKEVNQDCEGSYQLRFEEGKETDQVRNLV